MTPEIDPYNSNKKQEKNENETSIIASTDKSNQNNRSKRESLDLNYKPGYNKKVSKFNTANNTVNELQAQNSEKLISTRSYDRKKFKKMQTDPEMNLTGDQDKFIDNNDINNIQKRSQTSKNVEKKPFFEDQQPKQKHTNFIQGISARTSESHPNLNPNNTVSYFKKNISSVNIINKDDTLENIKEEDKTQHKESMESNTMNEIKSADLKQNSSSKKETSKRTMSNLDPEDEQKIRKKLMEDKELQEEYHMESEKSRKIKQK